MGAKVLIAATLLCGVCYPAGRPRIDLNGAWEFRTDPQSLGERQEWHSPGAPFDRTLQVPGAWQAQGVGEPSGILRHHYEGPAWYRRQVAVPDSWQGKAARIRVEGALRKVTLYVNGRRIGEHDGISAPAVFDVTAVLRPGAANTIAFRVENPGAAMDGDPRVQKGNQPTGMMNYIGNWGGLYGNVSLEASDPLWISEVAIRPDIARREAAFHVKLAGPPPSGSQVEIEAGEFRTSVPARDAEIDAALPMPGARLWSPDDPRLYTATIRLLVDGRERDRTEERFGMRQLATRGRALLLNGKPLYLRGYGDDNIEVLTGTPPASKDVYLERLRLARSFGFNAVRFHSMTPAPAFFEAADEVGLLVMAELPVAYTQYFLPHREFLKRELEGVLRAYRNRPSFLSLALGNEFNLTWLETEAEREEFQAGVAELYQLAKSIDPDRIVLSNDGLMLRPTDMASLYRGAPDDIPTVRHEFGAYYCSLPDPSLIPLFTGVIQPAWLEEKKKWVDASGLAGAYPAFLRNSQRLQQLGRKYQIERVRRDPDVTGYHYWLIVDFPGGTGEGDSWEEGWFDYFWRPKGIEPAEGREINSALLLLSGADVDERTLWTGESKTIDIWASNYGEEAVSGGALAWRLMDGGRSIAGSTIAGITAPLGEVSRIAGIAIGPVAGGQARKLELVVELTAGGNTYANRWNFWAFPRPSWPGASPAASRVVSTVRWAGLRRLFPFIEEGAASLTPETLWIASSLDRAALAHLESGGRVWLLGGREQFSRSGDATFFPASGGALGSLVRDHPALRGFPHDGFFDLQFYNLMEDGWSLSLDQWPQEIAPIAGGIRTTSAFLSKKKNLGKVGYIVEAKVGKGRLLVTTLAIRERLDEAYPEAVFLFDRLLRYASGPEFQPSAEAGADVIERLARR
ncbi:MAG: hypothetical protein KIT09_33380 [Bryobacteraceae bacterium]|nr:hypothetical protein [Bryobacteraceae bacterium]